MPPFFQNPSLVVTGEGFSFLGRIDIQIALLVRSEAEAAQGGGAEGVLEARFRATNAATFRFGLILRTGLRKRSAAFLLRQKPFQGFSPQKRLAEALPQFPPAHNLNVDSP